MPQVAVLELFGPKVLSIFRRHLNPWVGKMMRSPEEKSSTSIWNNFDTAWKLFPTQNASKLNNSGLGFAELVTKRPPRAKTWERKKASNQWVLDSESKDFLMRYTFFGTWKQPSSQNITSAYAPKTITKDLCWCWRNSTSLRFKTPMRLRRRLCCRGAGSKA